MFTNTNYIYDMDFLDNELALATSGGVAIYDIGHGEFSVINNADGLLTNACYSIAIDLTQDTVIWVGSRRGLTMITTNQIANYPLPIVTSSDIRAIKLFGDTIFVGSSNGLVVIDTKKTLDFNDDEVTTIMTTNQLISDTVLSIAVGDKIWIGTDKGISRFFHNLTYDTSFTMNEGLPGPRILSLYSQDSIFAGTDSGLTVVKNDSIQILLSGEEIRDITLVGDTIFFASDDGFGIFHQGSIWHENDFLPTKDVRAVEYIGNKRWLGLGSGFSHDFWGEGIAYFENYWRIDNNHGPNSNWISDLEVADHGDIFLSHGYRAGGHNRGASRLSTDSTWTDLNEILPDSITQMSLTHRLTKDQTGRIWFIHNWSGGLIFFDPATNSWGLYDSLQTNYPVRGAWAGSFDDRNNMLVAVAEPQGKPCVLIDSSLNQVLEIGSSDDFVVDVAIDSGRYWIIYWTEGIELIEHQHTPFELTDDRVYYFTTSEGLPSVNSRAAITDGEGRLYYLSEKGLSYIIRDSDGQYTITNYTSDNSPLSSNCKFYALTIDSQDRIWILANIGLYNYNPVFDSWNVYYFTDLGLDLQFRDVEEFQNHAFKFDYLSGCIWLGSKNGLVKLDLQRTAQIDLDSIIIYPNPSTQGLTIFANLPDGSEVTVFSISGTKITELGPPDSVFKQIIWNWLADNIKSGVYLALIKTNDGSRKTIKFAIIR